MVARGESSCATIGERPVHRPDRLEDPVTLAIETRGQRSREDRIAFEFDDGEVGLQALEDGVQEGPKNGVGGWDARAEIDPVLAAFVAAGSVAEAAARVGVRLSTAKRHLADLRARSGLTTEQLIYRGRAEGWLIVPSLESDLRRLPLAATA